MAVVLSVAVCLLLSPSASQRRGTGNMAAYGPANVLCWCKELLLCVCMLFLAISHTARGMSYLCKRKKTHPQQTPPQPSPLWEGVVSTAICENPVASVLSVFNSPLTLRTETIHPLRFARPTCLRGTVCYNRLVTTPLILNLLTFNKIPLYPLFLHRHRASLVPSIQGEQGL